MDTSSILLEQSAAYFLDMETLFVSTQEDNGRRIVATASVSPCFTTNPYYCFPSTDQSVTDGSTTDTTARTNESSISIDSNHTGANKVDYNYLFSMPENNSSRDSSIEEKRKNEDGDGLDRNSKDANGNRTRSRREKQVKIGGILKETEKKKKQWKDEEGKKKETMLSESAKETPAGYIHVRARRGQATDSHSLAERVRREKISMRMKVLQGLVPGCDKVVGKALMLDNIINYVQSLQNQVEFLSIRLASANPLLRDYGVVDLDDFISQSQISTDNNPQQQQMLSANTYPVIDTSTSLPLNCEGTSTIFSQINNNSIQMQLCNGLISNNNNNTHSYSDNDICGEHSIVNSLL